MKLIQILPNIYGVKVPSDANDFKLFFEFGHTRVSYNNLAEKKIPLTEYTFQNLVLNELVDFKILGTLTKDEISFDFEEIFGLDWDAFRSALPEDIYFENPFEEPKKNDYVFEEHPELVGNPKEYDEETYQLDLQDYQTSQENITHKLLILQKV